jgi:protein-L-isoaspartate(D-aspartate) O-methyltransferase
MVNATTTDRTLEEAMSIDRSPRDAAGDPRLEDAREAMLRRDIAGRGVRDEHVLAAMRSVPREVFVPPEMKWQAYADAPLPIGEEQTISQPFIVAYMAALAELKPGDRVLEVGTGSGYAAAVFSRVARDVYTVERHRALADGAREKFEQLGYENIHVDVRDGTLGWPEHAPYDAIVVAAAAPEMVPPSLVDQLAPGGRLVLPRGGHSLGQELVRVRRSADGGTIEEESLGAVSFVPLIGEEGAREDEHASGSWFRR